MSQQLPFNIWVKYNEFVLNNIYEYVKNNMNKINIIYPIKYVDINYDVMYDNLLKYIYNRSNNKYILTPKQIK